MIHQNSNMAPRHSGQTFVFGFVFFVRISLHPDISNKFLVTEKYFPLFCRKWQRCVKRRKLNCSGKHFIQVRLTWCFSNDCLNWNQSVCRSQSREVQITNQINQKLIQKGAISIKGGKKNARTKSSHFGFGSDWLKKAACFLWLVN